ncbi:MAG TPA: hypothetical protein VF624_06590 [Tepidisphaeraceae bacterium]|jgi:hypothetical protein
MHHPDPAASPPLEYATPRRRRPRRPYVLAVTSVALAYLLLYVALRVTGVFYPYYSQGGWEIDGGTGIYAVDIPFLPLAILEGGAHNRLRWLPVPAGG